MIKSLKTEDIKTKEDVFNALSVYLNDALELSNRKCRDEENFSLPAWSEYQAYQLGMQKAFVKILDLIPRHYVEP